MTEEALFNEYRSSDCKSFTDFLINKIAELKTDNDARKFARAMSEKVEKQLREENAELQHKVDTLQGFLDRDVEFDNLRKENAELKAVERMALYSKLSDQLTNAKEIIKLLLWDLRNRSYEPVKDVERAEQFLKNDGCPDVMCEDCTKEDCGVRQLGLVEVEK